MHTLRLAAHLSSTARGSSLNPDVRHKMKTLSAILFTILICPILSAAHGIHIWIGRDNGADVIYTSNIDTPITTHEIHDQFSKHAQYMTNSVIYVGIHPDATANTIFELVGTLRDVGINNITLYRTDSDREIILPMVISPEPRETNSVEQGGPGYPPQGVGSPDP